MHNITIIEMILILSNPELLFALACLTRLVSQVKVYNLQMNFSIPDTTK